MRDWTIRTAIHVLFLYAVLTGFVILLDQITLILILTPFILDVGSHSDTEATTARMIFVHHLFGM